MPIRSILPNGHFTPEEVTVLVGVFEDALRGLKLVDRSDPAMTLIAKRIIDIARQGERDPDTLRAAVLKSFRDDPGVSGM
jgi:hypothetical protein